MGAGDTLSGVVIGGLQRGLALEESARLGVCGAYQTVTSPPGQGTVARELDEDTLRGILRKAG